MSRMGTWLAAAVVPAGFVVGCGGGGTRVVDTPIVRCPQQTVLATSHQPEKPRQVPVAENARFNSHQGLRLMIAPIDLPNCPDTCLALTLAYGAGVEPLWVNTSLAPSPVRGKPENVVLEVRNSETDAIRRPSCFEKPGVGNVPEYMVFVQGTEVRRVADLSCYMLAAGSQWKVVAHYRDVNTEAPMSPPYARWFKDELVSNEILLAARGAKGIER